ncbi:MOG interacting and ectopic P-granules protein 1 [Halotydeus destructor]|nr:MOG interacting and ectopic P-granules protein 1 [Halotydeus destructor]
MDVVELADSGPNSPTDENGFDGNQEDELSNSQSDGNHEADQSNGAYEDDEHLEDEQEEDDGDPDGEAVEDAAEQSKDENISEAEADTSCQSDPINLKTESEGDKKWRLIAKSLLDQIPEAANEETGFPEAFVKAVLIGKCIPIHKKTWTNIEIDGDDAILDCASQVVPLMVKKPNIFPMKLPKETSPPKPEAKEDDVSHEEDDEKPEQDDEENGVGEVSETTGEGTESKAKPTAEEKASSKSTMLTIDEYYTSTVGNMLLTIGLSRAKEWYHRDAVKQVHKAIRKEGEQDELIEELKKQQAIYTACKNANSIFVFPAKKCPLCDFKTESSVSMEQHMSIPHLSNKREYKCNYCTFSSRDPRTIAYHFQSEHNKPCVIETPPQLYECPACSYDSSQKQKAAAHITKCMKFFVADKVQYLADPEAEYPAITPKPITQGDIKIYEATLNALRQAASTPGIEVPEIPGLPRGLQQQMLQLQQHQLALQARNRPKGGIIRQPAPNRSAGGVGNQAGSYVQTNAGPVPHYGANARSAAPHLYHMLQTGGGHTQLVPIQQRGAAMATGASAAAQHIQLSKNRFGGLGIHKNQLAGLANKPNIIAKGSPALQTGGTVANKAAPSGDLGNSAAKSGTFVICEICDGYIKDLEQLRTHMQWIHKVKIHPKMLASRPPLNCQKCQWRFFTDQGLERHLLGAHGLVTSNMQDMVNQNQDGGRCTVCGRVFANKLVAHMNQVHKVTLKPAHLSYKCTVCSATFNLYKLFENHVYMVHSGSVKRNATGDGEQLAKKQKTIAANSENKPKANGTEAV